MPEKNRKRKSRPPIIRKAVLSDLKVLNDLAVRSEAYWGFDEKHMGTFKRKYLVTKTYIEKGYIFVIEKSGEILGFYSLVRKGTGYELKHNYVDPRHIRTGLGKTLWQHLRRLCPRREIKEVTIVCSDFVKDFYLKMGATNLGPVESSVDRGKMIAKLTYHINLANK